MIEALALMERASSPTAPRPGDQMTTQERQNEAILIELGIDSHPDVPGTGPVMRRFFVEEELRTPVETETALVAAVPQTTPWHQW